MLSGVFMLMISMMAPVVVSDGWHPSVEYLHLYEPYQKAVIYWNSISETMILASAVQAENLTDIAWIVPIISTSIPNVSAGNISVFQDLVEYFKDKEAFWYLRDSIEVGDSGNVTILEVKEVDIYDIIILKATNASDLIGWLKAHAFQVPEETYSVLETYVVMDNCYFVINKIDLKNRFAQVLGEIENGTVSYSSPEYREYRRVVKDLQYGMATPLKFEFTPPEPYYPLTISSLNRGYGNIEVYVIAEHPVTDLHNVLQLDDCKEVTENFRETLAQYFSVNQAAFVTRLIYRGWLTELSADAVFTFFPVSIPEIPISVHSTPDVEVIVTERHIWGIAWGNNGTVFEVHYRLDDEEVWRVANGSKLWCLDLGKISLPDGGHTLFIRLVSQGHESVEYSDVASFSFSSLGGHAVSASTLQNHMVLVGVVLLSVFMVCAVVIVAAVSRKDVA